MWLNRCWWGGRFHNCYLTRNSRKNQPQSLGFGRERHRRIVGFPDHGRAVIFSFGSEQFVRQVKSRLAASPSSGHGIPPRQLSRLDRQEVYEAVLKHYGRPPEAVSQRGARERCRGVAAYLARRLTGATVRELATDLGLSRPDIMPNLTRRIERDLQETRALAKEIRAIEKALLEEQTTNKA